MSSYSDLERPHTHARVVVFLPTYNESENLPVLVEQIFSLGLDASILIVDDQSPDGTGAVADRWAAAYPDRIWVIHRDGPRGRGSAGIIGLAAAASRACAYVVEMDADLSHDPAQLPLLLEAIEAADVVIGSRYLEGGELSGLVCSVR
jgi:dolichol-phosphate mannosyltransferase